MSTSSPPPSPRSDATSAGKSLSSSSSSPPRRSTKKRKLVASSWDVLANISHRRRQIELANRSVAAAAFLKNEAALRAQTPALALSTYPRRWGRFSRRRAALPHLRPTLFTGSNVRLFLAFVFLFLRYTCSHNLGVSPPSLFDSLALALRSPPPPRYSPPHRRWSTKTPVKFDSGC